VRLRTALVTSFWNLAVSEIDTHYGNVYSRKAFVEKETGPMYARAVDDGEERLRALRREEWGDLGVAGVAVAAAVAATLTRPDFALPLFLGGVIVGACGIRALWRRWDLVARLAGEGDAHVIPEVLAYARRHATMDSRRCFAASIRSRLPRAGFAVDARIVGAADVLEALADELEDETLDLDPAAAVACMRLLSDPCESPLLNLRVPPENLRSRVCQIRAGFTPVG